MTGLQLARERCPAIILIDLMLPEIDGFERLPAAAARSGHGAYSARDLIGARFADRSSRRRRLPAPIAT